MASVPIFIEIPMIASSLPSGDQLAQQPVDCFVCPWPEHRPIGLRQADMANKPPVHLNQRITGYQQLPVLCCQRGWTRGGINWRVSKRSIWHRAKSRKIAQQLTP